MPKASAFPVLMNNVAMTTRMMAATPNIIESIHNAANRRPREHDLLRTSRRIIEYLNRARNRSTLSRRERHGNRATLPRLKAGAAGIGLGISRGRCNPGQVQRRVSAVSQRNFLARTRCPNDLLRKDQTGGHQLHSRRGCGGLRQQLHGERKGSHKYQRNRQWQENGMAQLH